MEFERGKQKMATLKISVLDTIKTADVFGVFKKKQKTEYKFPVILNNIKLVLDILFRGVQSYGRPPTNQNIVNLTEATL